MTALDCPFQPPHTRFVKCTLLCRISEVKEHPVQSVRWSRRCAQAPISIRQFRALRASLPHAGTMRTVHCGTSEIEWYPVHLVGYGLQRTAAGEVSSRMLDWLWYAQKMPGKAQCFPVREQEASFWQQNVSLQFQSHVPSVCILRSGGCKLNMKSCIVTWAQTDLNVDLRPCRDGMASFSYWVDLSFECKAHQSLT